MRSPRLGERAKREGDEIDWRWVIAVIAVLCLGYWYVHDGRPKPAPEHATSLAEWLDRCSPFESFDGTRDLWFQADDRSVSLVSEPATDQDSARAESKKSIAGTWVANEETREIKTNVGGQVDKYTLILLPNESQCILSDGEISSTNLKNSWFGVPDADLSYSSN